MSYQLKKTLIYPSTLVREELMDNFNEKEESQVEHPVLSIILNIMIIYTRILRGDFQGADIIIQKMDQAWKELDKRELKDEKISENVLDHIIQATKVYFYEKSNAGRKMHILQQITSSDSFQSIIEESTINGLKAIAWSFFHEKYFTESLLYAQLAREGNPECPLWYYIEAKNLRRSRKHNFIPNPSETEKDRIFKCCELSNKPFYKLSKAQYYKERGQAQKNLKMFNEALKLYSEIKNSCPTSVNTQLRCALAFIRAGKKTEAKECIEYVEKSEQTKDKMFLHYKGIYLQEIEEDYEAAVMYFKLSAKSNNYPADLDCAKCLKKMDKITECKDHLFEMLKKYENVKNYNQQIRLHIAMLFYREKNLFEASNYFSEALQIDPESDQLKKYRDIFGNQKYFNIINIIRDELIQELKKYASKINKSLNNFKTLVPISEKPFKSNYVNRSINQNQPSTNRRLQLVKRLDQNKPKNRKNRNRNFRRRSKNSV